MSEDMVAIPPVHQASLNASDREALTDLVNEVVLSDSSLTQYAVAPESAPDHPVVEAFKTQLHNLEESLQICNFFYSDNSLFNFLAKLDSQFPAEAGRRVILAFGLEQLPTPRLKQELEQLNLAREKIFEQNLVLVFWLNRSSFLDEFRSRAPDFWDWRGRVAVFETRHPLLYPYLEWLIADNSYLTMSGVMQVNRQVDIFLDQIYVSLQAERRQQITTTSKRQQASTDKTASLNQANPSSVSSRGENLGKNFSPEPTLELEQTVVELEASSTKTVTEKVDLAEVVRSPHTCSVILGAPGAGKTTLLKYLVLHFAKALRDKQDVVHGGAEQASLGQPLWPIFFKIADYAERLESHPDLGLLDYLQQFYRSWKDYFEGSDAPALSNRLLEQMHRGECLILLDGLDEVFDQDSRRQIVERINAFAEQFGHNKLIVTSRIAGYQEVKLASRFTEFTITDMSDDQVSDFLHRWCQAVEKAQKPEATAEQQEREGTQQAERILSDIQRSEGVKRLTTNPLLLTILALIHRNGEQLPARRVKLYELAVQTLTADWQLSKKLPNMQKVLLPEGEVVELLAPLAYWMHEEKPSGQVTHAEVIEQLAPRLAVLRGEAPDSHEILEAVEEFLRRVRETTGLFVERAPNVYGFMHLTFEEYFAARAIADKDPNEILATIQQHWHEPRWVEPILLALGYYGSYSPGQFNRLIEKLFQSLAEYQPVLGQDAIKLQGGISPDAQIQWIKADEPDNAQEFSLRDLLFAGQVIAQVGEVTARLRKKLINQLVVTGLALAMTSGNDEEAVNNQILQLLFQIEQFNQQGEVVKVLQHVIQDASLLKEIHLNAKVAKLYVLCGDTETDLVDCVTELVQTIEPNLFCALRDLARKLGKDMSPALEMAVKQQSVLNAEKHELTFVVAMTYIREKYYDKAISLFETISKADNQPLMPYLFWSLATCFQKKEEYDKASEYYQKCLEPLNGCIAYWKDQGICQRQHEKYEQALDCFQHMLTIAQDLQNLPEQALALYHLGKTYQVWGKYEEAIACHQQSRDLYQQLEKKSNVARQWYWIADCYWYWEKYEQALDAEHQDLALRQELDDQPNIANAYFQLGWIYQGWEKYAEAIAYYEQSRDLYQQLEKESAVAGQWYWLAVCYREWGQYEQAVEAEHQDLSLRQKLNDQPNIADSYFQLGRIYQAWGKNEEAIAHYKQSRELYQQLEKESNVADLWYWMAVCYREWGQYEQALEAERQDLALRQKLNDQSRIALAYYQLGRIYQAWDKYTEAIAHYEQSRDLNQQLEKESNVAGLCYWMAVCYREWGQYKQALEAERQNLALRQKLDSQPDIANAYYQLGRIYQAWGKHAEAIAHYEQSRDLYQQLEKESNVADLCYWMAVCYLEWGQYKQALEAERQDLALRQKLDSQPDIANAYYQLGRIYQAWGKHAEAIAHYEQSRDLYQQLEKESDVANQWFWMAACYREWGQYEQALEAERQDLALRQNLNNQPNIANAYYQLGRIYQAWGKYAEAVTYYEQSRDLYQQLEKESDVADLWYWMAICYREEGQYKQSIEAEHQELTLRQKLDDQPNIADAYYQLGRVYQVWGKLTEAIAHHEQSRKLFEQLDLQQRVANQFAWLAVCYRGLKDYPTAIKYHSQSLEKCQALGHTENFARQLRQLAHTQRLQAKDSTCEEAGSLLQQAQKNLQQAIYLDTDGDYRENLAYDQILLALLIAEQLRWLSLEDSSIPGCITQFERAVANGFAYFTELGQITDSADEALDIARVYLEIEPLANLDKAEALAKQSLKTFQEFNRRKLQADANKLLGEIYQARACENVSSAVTIAIDFFTTSLNLYRELDLSQKVTDVEELLANVQNLDEHSAS